MPDWEAWKEAEKRGIIPEDKKATWEEVKRRGLHLKGLKPVKTDSGREMYLQTGKEPTGEVDTRTGEQIQRGGVPTGVQPPSFSAMSEAAGADTTPVKIKIFAKHRGISPDKYTTVNGRIAYMDDEGILHYEDSTKLKEFAAGMVGNAPPIIGGMVGGVPGAILGETGQKIFNYARYGEEQPIKDAAIDLGVEGGTTLLGGKMLGGSGIKASNVAGGLGKKQGRKLANLMKGGWTKAEAEKTVRVVDEARASGIDISIPQASGNRELINRLIYLGDLPASANKVQMFKQIQDEQVENAFNSFMKTVSPDGATKEAVEEGLVATSKKSVDRTIRVRQAKAQPYYEKAFASGDEVDVKPVVDFIKAESKTAKGDILQAYKTSKRLLEKPDLPKKDPAGVLVDSRGNLLKPTGVLKYDTSLKGLNDAKKAIDVKIQTAQRKGQYDVARVYKQVKKQLLEEMDAVSPDYKRARKIFESYSTEVDKQAAKKGAMIGKIAKLEGDDITKASNKLFKENPQVISRVKGQIIKEDPKAWDRIAKVYLDDAFKGVQESMTGDTVNWAGHLYKKLFNTVGKKDKAKAVLSNKQYKNFKSLMNVFNKISKIYKNESMTAARQEISREMTNTASARVLRAWAYPLYPKERLFVDKVILMKERSFQKKMVDLMLDTEKAPKQFAKLHRLSPTGEKFWREFGILLGFSTKESIEEEIWKDKDFGEAL